MPMYARTKPLLDREGIIALARLSSADLLKGADAYSKRLREMTGAVKVYRTNSGRAALALGLKALGVGRGDEVVVPALTCPAVADAVVSAGGIPRLCDISARTLSIRPGSLRRILAEKRTRAVVDAPLLGTVPPAEDVATICRDAGVPLVMDVAQSLACRRRGAAVASFGQIAVVSTNVDKPFTTGRGGALLVMDQNCIAAADESFLAFKTQDKEEGLAVLKGLAMSDRLFSCGVYEGFVSIDVPFAYAEAEGYAYDLEDLFVGEAGARAAERVKSSKEKLSGVGAAGFVTRFKRRFRPRSAVPGIGPAKKLATILSAVGALHIVQLEGERRRRSELVEVLDRELAGFPGVEVVSWKSDDGDEPWPLRYPVLLNDYRRKNDIITKCAGAGYEVGSYIYPRPLSGQFPYYKISRYSGRYLRGAWRVAAGMINIPLHHEIKPEDVEKVAKVIKG